MTKWRNLGQKSASLLKQASHLRWPVFAPQRLVRYAGLKKYTENDRPLTDNVVFTAISGFLFLSVQRFLSARSRTGSLRDDNVRRLCDSFCRGERLFARRGGQNSLAVTVLRKEHRCKSSERSVTRCRFTVLR